VWISPRWEASDNSGQLRTFRAGIGEWGEWAADRRFKSHKWVTFQFFWDEQTVKWRREVVLLRVSMRMDARGGACEFSDDAWVRWKHGEPSLRVRPARLRGTPPRCTDTPQLGQTGEGWSFVLTVSGLILQSLNLRAYPAMSIRKSKHIANLTCCPIGAITSHKQFILSAIQATPPSTIRPSIRSVDSVVRRASDWNSLVYDRLQPKDCGTC